jgi:murein DD-endopeptidase MepM/ murein hydrolase activator NlpD
MLPTKSGKINVAYGVRGSFWAAGYHTGTDFDASVGTSLYATKGGRVVFVGYHNGWGAAYGNHVIISSWHKGVLVRHMYAHMSSFAVGVGDTVKAGQLIGKSGNTGNTTGPHCHYEERTAPFGYYNNKAPRLLSYEPRPTISLSKVQPGKNNLHVAKLKRRLNKYFPKKKPIWGTRFNAKLRDRYAEYQRNLGYEGKAANGVPGKASLEKLGFRVVK